MDSAGKIDTLKQALRMEFSGDPAGLRIRWREVLSRSTEFVTFTGDAYEGASTTGALVLEPLEYLKACQDVLAEIDPAGTPAAPPPGTFVDFRAGFIET